MDERDDRNGMQGGQTPGDPFTSEVDDAFGFRPEQPATGYNANVPPPAAQYRAARQNDFGKRLLFIALAVLLAVGLFIAGFYTRQFSYTEQARVFDWAMKQIDKYYIGDDVEGLKADVKADLDKYLNGLESELDPYSSFLTPAEFEEMENSLAGRNADYGLRVKGVYTSGTLNGFEIKGTLVGVAVHSVIFNSSAEKSGLQPDDLLYKLDGVEVDVTDLDRTLYAKIEGTNSVRVTVKRPRYIEGVGVVYEELPEMTLTAAEYNAQYLRYYETAEDLASGVYGMDVLPEDTAYLKFIGFQGNADAEFKAAMDSFKRDGKKNLILDLRDNGGGYLNLLQYIASYLVQDQSGKSVPIMINEYKDKSKSVIKSDNRLFDEGGKVFSTNDGWYSGMGFNKIVALVNSGTASASEVLLAAMADYGTLDAVIGMEKTYGKGIGQTTFQYNNSYALTITTMRWYSPKGTWVQKRTGENGEELGRIAPTVVTRPNFTNYPYSPEKDPDIVAAIASISGSNA